MKRSHLFTILTVVTALCTGAAILRFFVAGGSLATSAIEGNERAAIEALDAVKTLETLWKEGDADGNGKADWWTADWSGFRRVLAKNGKPVAMMSGSLAAADAAPLPPSAGLAPELPRAPHLGYWFRALKVEGAYGFEAHPAEPGKTGRRTFLVGEDGRVWAKESAGEIAEWPPGGESGLRAAGWVHAK